MDTKELKEQISQLKTNITSDTCRLHHLENELVKSLYIDKVILINFGSGVKTVLHVTNCECHYDEDENKSIFFEYSEGLRLFDEVIYLEEDPKLEVTTNDGDCDGTVRILDKTVLEVGQEHLEKILALSKNHDESR